MAIIVLQHDSTDGPGRLSPVLRDLAFKLDVRRLDLWAAAGGKGPGGVPTDLDGVDAIISLGGPQNVGDSEPWMAAELGLIRAAHAAQLPVLGICLGAQLIATALGGEVSAAAKPEFGLMPVSAGPAGQTDTLLAGIAWKHPEFHAHGQEVTKVPEGAMVLQSSAACKVQSFRVGLRTYGFQYHFECTKGECEAFARDSFGVELMSKLGITPGDFKADLDSQYDEYARFGERLCRNIAQYMFPPVSRLR